MQDNRDDYEPIIATRPNRRTAREDARPLWPLVLALAGGVAAVLLAWWYVEKSSTEGGARERASAAATNESFPPEIRVDQSPTPPAIDPEVNGESAPASAPPAASVEPATSVEPSAIPQAAPEAAPEVVPDNAPQATPSPPATVSLRLTSPDAQVRFEVRDPGDSSPALTGKVGDIVELEPGTYRVVASGAQLETTEREITLIGGGPAEYSVELCAQPTQESESLVGQVVEQRTCASTPECESVFMVLSEYAEQLVKDRAFRTQACANWRDTAAPAGRWTLDTKCDGEASATTCRIEISAGTCTVTGPRRSARGEACPRAELQ